ncbi:MAG: hypothetical protein ACR2PL_17010, partial [Dehalococcoidia bacterium]
LAANAGSVALNFDGKRFAAKRYRDRGQGFPFTGARVENAYGTSARFRREEGGQAAEGFGRRRIKANLCQGGNPHRMSVAEKVALNVNRVGIETS